MGNWGPQFVNDFKISYTAYGVFISSGEMYPWIEVKLNAPQTLSGVECVNRGDSGAFRLAKLEVRAGMESVPSGVIGKMLTQNSKVGYYEGPGKLAETVEITFDSPTKAQYVTLQLTWGPTHLQLNEIKVLKNCTPIHHSIVDSVSMGEYVASNVLVEAVDKRTPPNFWTTQNGLKGDDAFFIMDLGCVQNIAGFKLKNSGNMAGGNTGVKKYSVFTSDSSTGPWVSRFTSEVQDVIGRQVATIPTSNYPLSLGASIPPTQYIKFVVDEYYGIKGAVQYFDVINSGNFESMNNLILYL